jgi:hypothetical protein
VSRLASFPIRLGGLPSADRPPDIAKDHSVAEGQHGEPNRGVPDELADVGLARQRGVDWQLKIGDARCKLASVYPKIRL